MKRVNARCDIRVVFSRAKSEKREPPPSDRYLTTAAAATSRVWPPVYSRLPRMCASPAIALLAVLVLALAWLLASAPLGLRRAPPRASRGEPPGPNAREGYLVYPYLDLDEPGERGQYYALTEC